ncbi:MAG: hypothetical protein NVSMB42_16710 [Herpetosiphon sp.]
MDGPRGLAMRHRRLCQMSVGNSKPIGREFYGLGILLLKEVSYMEWITPDFEEFETSCEVTAYANHW